MIFDFLLYNMIEIVSGTMVNVRYLVLNVQCSMSNVQWSIANGQCSMADS